MSKIGYTSGLNAIRKSIFLHFGCICMSFGSNFTKSVNCYKCKLYNPCSVISTIYNLFRGLGGKLTLKDALQAVKKIKEIDSVYLREMLLNKAKNYCASNSINWCEECEEPTLVLYCVNLEDGNGSRYYCEKCLYELRK
ncbi:MAG: hypothetical protein ACTSRA_00065 [Promethearchaeota archaeon]|nr:MAG: hypothetical protein [Helarchaeota virus Nidhogg Meg22_1012]URC17353.1 MAG: hypothetical protein [Helarchaeota virus Nidhogg Meg22_1214]